MYTIKEAASRSGVAIETIRAWERRYGIVVPARTDSGYRLYDDDAIRRLDAMRRLVVDGMQPSAAAAELRERGAESLSAPVSSARWRPDTDERSRLMERFVAGAAALDERSITAALDDIFARGSYERVATDILFPALQRLGQAWADGQVSVAGEHLASHIVQRRLGQMFEAAGAVGSNRRQVIIGLPPSSRHELGALAFAVAARRAGLAVAYLGADLPIQDWQAAARTARAAVVGVPTANDAQAAAEVVAQLAAGMPGLVVVVGGVGAANVPNVANVVRLPDQLDEAVATLKRAI